MVSSVRAAFTVKKPCGNSAHRSLLRALLDLISPASRILEVIIRKKCGTGAELLKRSPTGTDVVIYSNVTMTKKREGMDLGLGRGAAGGYTWLHPGNVRDKVVFHRAKNGSLVRVEATYRLIIKDDTREPEIVAVSRDITEKKALEI
jgi:hypothetical protein